MFRIFLLFSISFSSLGCNNPKPNNAPQAVPEFMFFNISNDQALMRTGLAVKGNIVFLFFDTGCIHCRNEISLIGENFSKFKNATFYLISQQDKGIVNDFMATYGKNIQNKPNVHVLLDKRYEFLPKFKPIQYPAIYVYGSDRKLKSYLDGENKIEEVIAAINE